MTSRSDTLKFMQPIEYQIKPIKQNASECMQTAATQVISHYDPSITVQRVIEEVPVYVENGNKIGTSQGHMAAYFARAGYKTTMYIFDVELFDRSWVDLNPHEVLAGLRERQKYIPANSWLAKYHHILVDGFELYVKEGGNFAFPQLSAKLLRDLLDSGPYLILLSSTYLNQAAKQRYNQESDTFVADPIQGRSLTHAVTCAGYKDGQFLIVDPDPPRDTSPHRWIAQEHLIASIMVAQTESDNYLIKIDNPIRKLD